MNGIDLKRNRVYSGYTQKELADHTGVSERTVRNLEKLAKPLAKKYQRAFAFLLTDYR